MMANDDLNHRLRATFLQELEDQLSVMESSLLTLEADSADQEAVRSLFRAAHSVKGAARVAGVPLVEEACHALETVFADVRDGRRRLSGGEFSLLFAVTDGLGDARRRLVAGQPLEGSVLETLVPRVRGTSPGAAGDRGRANEPDAPASGQRNGGLPSSDAPAAPADRAEAPGGTATPTDQGTPEAPGDARSDQTGEATTGPGPIGDSAAHRTFNGTTGAGTTGDAADDRTSAFPAPPARPEPRVKGGPPDTGGGDGTDLPDDIGRGASGPESIRVSTNRLDELAGFATDLLTTSGAVADHPRELEELRNRLSRWAAVWRTQSRDVSTAIDRDEHAELDRQLHQITATIARLTRESLDHTRILTRTTSDVLAGVRGLRMRRLGDAVEGLPRAARDVAAETGKKVRLVIEGEDVEADRMVIDALREPLLHLVRNAIDHGIEEPEERRRQGKPAEGTVRLAAKIERGRLRILVQDDGRGIDVEGVRRQIESRGETAPSDPRSLAQRLLAGGITTREKATNFSGRGVGLDIVTSGMERIGGSVSLRWKPGTFTRFTLDSPPSPTTLRAVIAEASDQLFALPIGEVDRVVRVQPDRVKEVDGRPSLTLGNAPIPIATLAGVLGPPLRDRQEIAGAPALILRAGEDSLALVVDGIADEREVVVRPLERKAHIPLVSGGALLPSGRVALVLVPQTLVDAGLSDDSTPPVIESQQAPAETRNILVVDDSITTRTLEQSVLEAAGYRVSVAVDGQHAWDSLAREPPDLIVSDIEMPRMNGFDLCRRIRASKRFADLPVVLVTGMETAEDRALGMEVGADAYILKSSFDQTALLETIRQLIG